ncbi:MAG: hypothetical protein E6J30_04230 [Chloroflexi bacterium]|nr:MAG: hypothetical protein E6J30_04230 [Chloroflexota bacterium]TMD80189.1 MAG: hypothetical protein E6I77_01960 [Chloroflexota bacterium]TMG28304.1 MAG: hypothetical protein E6H97_05090 [Chloroflexota bacterium]
MRKLLMTSAAALVIAACGLPFGLGRASTSQLENGAADNLAKAKSVEAKGTFTQDTTLYKFDTKYVAPATEDVQVTQGSLSYEALQINGKIYFKGSGYLESQITDPTEARQLAKVVGDRWYTSKNAQPVDTSAITDANKVKANFLSTIADKRTDDVVVDGQKTAELTLSDFILNITEDSPYRLVRLRSANSKTVQGISKVDMKFTSYGKDFALAAPNNVFDFDDPTTWPPRYQVDAVHQQEASAGSCGDPCVLSADVENTGGLNGAAAPSTVTFVLTASDQSSLGSCKATIQPDRPHGQKFTVSCSIQTSAWTNYAGDYKYGATADNPAYD